MSIAREAGSHTIVCSVAEAPVIRIAQATVRELCHPALEGNGEAVRDAAQFLQDVRRIRSSVPARLQERLRLLVPDLVRRAPALDYRDAQRRHSGRHHTAAGTLTCGTAAGAIE
jgi:hypothetical protein